MQTVDRVLQRIAASSTPEDGLRIAFEYWDDWERLREAVRSQPPSRGKSLFTELDREISRLWRGCEIFRWLISAEDDELLAHARNTLQAPETALTQGIAAFQKGDWEGARAASEVAIAYGLGCRDFHSVVYGGVVLATLAAFHRHFSELPAASGWIWGALARAVERMDEGAPLGFMWGFLWHLIAWRLIREFGSQLVRQTFRDPSIINRVPIGPWRVLKRELNLPEYTDPDFFDMVFDGCKALLSITLAPYPNGVTKDDRRILVAIERELGPWGLVSWYDGQVGAWQERRRQRQTGKK